MLTGLRISLAILMLLTLALCTYALITDNFTILPYIQFTFSCFFILMGINELKSGRKSMSIPYFFVSSLMFFVLISTYFR
ncbi:hypothetical protein CN941_15330 [Bacillus cereus]|uniref:Uncharacterized protein n=1 Tax=Bacillus cereus TaxID=1396 RepID=A0A2B8RGW1_BACCE|nr:hypothetical protein CON40_06195 [Bacillus cereus]PEU02519.1 hypothetical protein CN527_08330 [Bacillus cereus]PEW01387.1 hypothetical protein CN428_15865 [Bacillus cereus]PEZ92221.1 hypothetical protein CN374_05360 [Bacillus cereus]PFA32838.1 hypothetical protein CN390_14220 [Bacillus cereus]